MRAHLYAYASAHPTLHTQIRASHTETRSFTHARTRTDTNTYTYPCYSLSCTHARECAGTRRFAHAHTQMCIARVSQRHTRELTDYPPSRRTRLPSHTRTHPDPYARACSHATQAHMRTPFLKHPHADMHKPTNHTQNGLTHPLHTRSRSYRNRMVRT